MTVAVLDKIRLEKGLRPIVRHGHARHRHVKRWNVGAWQTHGFELGSTRLCLDGSRVAGRDVIRYVTVSQFSKPGIVGLSSTTHLPQLPQQYSSSMGDVSCGIYTLVPVGKPPCELGFGMAALFSLYAVIGTRLTAVILQLFPHTETKILRDRFF